MESLVTLLETVEPQDVGVDLGALPLEDLDQDLVLVVSITTQEAVVVVEEAEATVDHLQEGDITEVGREELIEAEAGAVVDTMKVADQVVVVVVEVVLLTEDEDRSILFLVLHVAN